MGWMPPSRKVPSWTLLLPALTMMMRGFAGAQTPSPPQSSSAPHSSFELETESCDMELFVSARSMWASEDDPCHQKLSFHMWTLMKSGGTAQDVDAMHVLDKCLQSRDVNLLELITPEVQELIAGLENLGCTRTRGEDQTVCIMSDSINRTGQATALQNSGDLPSFEIVKELPENFTNFIDEGSAMMELAFDIASGANFKFNTAFTGEEAFADDIEILAGVEECDVIVDDVRLPFSPGYRDGVIAQAVDAAVEAGALYFTSAGNAGSGMRFDADFECTTELPSLESFVFDSCPNGGVAAHVFEPSETGASRYLFPIDSASLNRETTMFLLQWDDDDFSARDITFYILAANSITGAIQDVTFGEKVNVFYLGIIQLDSPVEAVAMHFFAFNDGLFFPGSTSGGSMNGHKCATTAISVAAMNWDAASGEDGSFADPEISRVTTYSSRGPCIVDAGDGLQTRDHPVTTAATSLQTSNEVLSEFNGTSASAPVAAAIATLIRGACFGDKVVRYDEMMEMLTNYEYTIDVTSDADGAIETYGVEAGYGLISAEQALGWIASNCQQACPGSTQPSPAPVATPAPSAAPSAAPVVALSPAPVATPATSAAPVVALSPTPVATPAPSAAPIVALSPAPVATPAPSAAPVVAPSSAPVATPAPVLAIGSTAAPTRTHGPSSAPSPVPSEICTNGIRGVEGYGHCCALECGVCGGRDCRKRATAVGLGAADCCVQRISESGVYCDDSGTAPCIITPDDPQVSPCSNGLTGIEGYGQCCVLECGTCGGRNCAKRAEDVGLEAADCCVQRISKSGVYCDESGAAPCIINTD